MGDLNSIKDVRNLFSNFFKVQWQYPKSQTKPAMLVLLPTLLLTMCGSAVSASGAGDRCLMLDSCYFKTDAKSCSCRPDCRLYGTCCLGADQGAPDSEPAFECYGRRTGDAFFVRRSCKPDYHGHPHEGATCVDDDVDEADIVSNLLMTNSVTKVTYWNKQCAKCNDEDVRVLDFWDIVVQCNATEGVDGGFVRRHLRFDLEALRWGLDISGNFLSCDVHYSPPDSLDQANPRGMTNPFVSLLLPALLCACALSDIALRDDRCLILDNCYFKTDTRTCGCEADCHLYGTCCAGVAVPPPNASPLPDYRCYGRRTRTPLYVVRSCLTDSPDRMACLDDDEDEMDVVGNLLVTNNRTKVKYCNPNLIQTCPPDFPDRESARKCTQSYAERKLRNSEVYFRNVYCAICHGVDEKDVECTGMSAGPEDSADESDFRDVTEVVFSGGQWLHKPPGRMFECSPGYAYDPYRGKCRASRKVTVVPNSAPVGSKATFLLLATLLVVLL